MIYYRSEIIQKEGRQLTPRGFHDLWAQLRPGDLLGCTFRRQEVSVGALLLGPGDLRQATQLSMAESLSFWSVPIVGFTASELRKFRLYASDPTFALGHPDSQSHLADSIVFALDHALEDWLDVDWPMTLTLGVRNRVRDLGNEAAEAVVRGDLCLAEIAAGTAKVIEEETLGSAPIWGGLLIKCQKLLRVYEARQPSVSLPGSGASPLPPPEALEALQKVSRGILEDSVAWPAPSGEEMAFPPQGSPAARAVLGHYSPTTMIHLLALLWLGRSMVAARSAPWTYFRNLLLEAWAMDDPTGILATAADLGPSLAVANRLLEHQARGALVG